MILSDIAIILCRVEESGNVGAVCRAMKNMGLKELRLAGQIKTLDENVIKTRAIHAADIWEGAGHYADLAEAIADCSLVIGTTRRMGKHRKAFPLTPREAASYLSQYPGKAALVFGNEKSGLNRQELTLCNLASFIPANEEFSSLNLSHALQVYAYELRQSFNPGTGGRWEPLPRHEVDAVVKTISDSLASLGFYKQRGREEQREFFRDIICRAALTIREGRYLEGIFKKAAKLGTKGSGG